MDFVLFLPKSLFLYLVSLIFKFFFFNKHFSIDSTYRYIWLEKIQSKDQNIVDKKFNDNGHMVTIGVNFHF